MADDEYVSIVLNSSVYHCANILQNAEEAAGTRHLIMRSFTCAADG